MSGLLNLKKGVIGGGALKLLEEPPATGWMHVYTFLGEYDTPNEELSIAAPAGMENAKALILYLALTDEGEAGYGIRFYPNTANGGEINIGVPAGGGYYGTIIVPLYNGAFKVKLSVSMSAATGDIVCIGAF